MSANPRKSILVVDDSPVVRSFHANILKMQGYQPVGACDGVDALEKALMGRFHLILCDINMPNMDGLTFIRRFREHDEAAPIIILTTHADPAHPTQGYLAGANLYLVKPVTPDKLTRHIELLLGGRP